MGVSPPKQICGRDDPNLHDPAPPGWPAGRPITTICAWCGGEFRVTTRKGAVPLYGRRSHRQRAHEARQRFRKDWWRNVHAQLRR